MIYTLYETFKKWSLNGSVYIIGDTHFCDNDCNLINNNWPKPEEQIKIINSKVTKNDTLIILGDVGEIKCVKKLNGYKVLIMGNHDKGASNYIRKVWVEEVIVNTEKDSHGNNVIHDNSEWLKNKEDFNHFSSNSIKQLAYFDNHLFDEVYEGPLIIASKILLSHEPVKYDYGVNIHGHCHGMKRKKHGYLNVASDVVNFTPVNLGELIKKGLLLDIKNIHRKTIDNRNKSRKNDCKKSDIK